MRRVSLGIVSLVVVVGQFAACSTSNSGSPGGDDGGGTSSSSSTADATAAGSSSSSATTSSTSSSSASDAGTEASAASSSSSEGQDASTDADGGHVDATAEAEAGNDAAVDAPADSNQPDASDATLDVADGSDGAPDGDAGPIEVITGLTITPENTHSYNVPPCGTGYTLITASADCGNANCYGNQAVCEESIPEPVEAGVAVITAITMTPEGTHLVGGGPCGTGFTTVASFADCGGTTCSGDQRVCIETVPAASGITVYTALYMTPEGTHVDGGGGCPSGFSEIGAIKDCGYAVCIGDQVICGKTSTLP